MYVLKKKKTNTDALNKLSSASAQVFIWEFEVVFIYAWATLPMINIIPECRCAQTK